MNPSFRGEAHALFREMVLAPQFSCVGAKAAFHSDSYAFDVYEELGSPAATTKLAENLRRFVAWAVGEDSEFATCVAVFAGPASASESEFEQLLWRQLQMLNAIDGADWDRDVSSDPSDSQFSFSFAGRALYVVGMHANSSRLSRRFVWPALVFNPHVQFEKLRSDGKWKRMQQTIREREMHLQGSINPMIHDFGESSEAQQYSGREVDESWRCPFHNVHAQRPA